MKVVGREYLLEERQGRPDGLTADGVMTSSRTRAIEQLLDEWDELGQRVEAIIRTIPDLPRMADVHRRMPSPHEHDIRGALAQPGTRDSDALIAVANAAVGGIGARLASEQLGTLHHRARRRRSDDCGFRACRDEPHASHASSSSARSPGAQHRRRSRTSTGAASRTPNGSCSTSSRRGRRRSSSSARRRQASLSSTGRPEPIPARERLRSWCVLNALVTGVDTGTV